MTESFLGYCARTAFMGRLVEHNPLVPYTEATSGNSSPTENTRAINGLHAAIRNNREARRVSQGPWISASNLVLACRNTQLSLPEGWINGRLAEPKKNIRNRYHRDGTMIEVDYGRDGYFVPVGEEVATTLFPDYAAPGGSVKTEAAVFRPFTMEGKKDNFMFGQARNGRNGLEEIGCMLRVSANGLLLPELSRTQVFREEDCTRNQKVALEEVALLTLHDLRDMKDNGPHNYRY